MVVTVPTALLYAPLSTTGRWFAWAGLVIAALASLLVALLVSRLLKTRTELVADIAQRRTVERQLSDAQTRFHRAFAEAPIGMALVDLDGGWRQVNQALCTMLRYSGAELLTATRDQLTHADDLGEDMEQVEALIAGEIDHCEMDKRFLDARGEVVWTSVSRSLVRDDDSGEPLYFIAQVQDVTERRQFEAKLSHLADHDALTGLFNRRRLEHELDRQVAYTERYQAGAALLMLDLDNFKYVNDTLGHAMGDELIVRVAQRPAGAPPRHRCDRAPGRRRVRDHPPGDRHRRGRDPRHRPARDDRARRRRARRAARDPGLREHRDRGDRARRAAHTRRADDERRRRDVRRQGGRPRPLLRP